MNPKLPGFAGHYPISFMHGIFTYIWLKCKVNVGKYTIHGLFGYVNLPHLDTNQVAAMFGRTLHDAKRGGSFFWEGAPVNSLMIHPRKLTYPLKNTG